MLDSAYISIGANRAFSCAAAFDDGVFAYGAGSTVALWDMNANGRGVYATLTGHNAHVTTLKCSGDGFVSGDQAGQVRVWARDGRTFTCTQTFTAHKNSSISALAVWGDEALTGGSDGIVRRWRIGKKVELIETLDLRGKLPLDLIIGTLPNSNARVLIMGLTDRKVQVWTLVEGSYRYALSLEGHEDWVRCLALTAYPGANGSDLLLATGAQDNYIRLWRISPYTGGGDMFDLSQLDGNAQISTKAHVLSAEGDRFNITLEALLVGHESGLTNVNWSHAESPRLLSSASDNSLVIWSPTDGEHDRDGIWVPEHRFGAFGGRGLSFFGAVWAPRDEAVIATGWTGGVERWVQKGDGWETSPGVSGHYGTVQSVAWEPAGDYLLSTGSDQTSRIHAPCRPSGSKDEVWAEIARPQIHGYDMVDAAFLSSFRFASAGEEKVTRVFEATTGFAESLSTLGVCSKSASEISHLPRGATVPPLGLSNRALGKAEAASDIPKSKLVPKDAVDRESVSTALTSLPTEEELSTSTLWPEIEKVYGHGYELATLATSHAGDLVATACRATSAEHAVVRIVDASTWADRATLPGHTLTVTRIAFSPDDSMVLTVSRDRGWRLFARDGEAWTPAASEERAHARMVLDCAWAGSAFVTASRDKTVKVWRREGEWWTCTTTHKLAEAATAVAVTPRTQDYLLAVGTEAGNIKLLVLGAADEVSPLTAVPNGSGHAGAVSRLAWRPDGKALASAGEDRAVRIFTLP
ncbi:WD40 repeat-like protein [Cutaneotrichosporon oleaginosum]|uniref:Elongator complex protein 2 n=1 Tax=Cutaneotrichosporon oleaginosum TaxID=879819 RepID=A0A0J1BDW8_9TREE|nr:WD40 repeat-like protein [Cutaneotrichosporon oleaginosum]KLT46269.1 WD40 repeat-like protein [Cutaneotrichosporon oleaginosum]TXT10273.1 hypothetical protein COLE_04207 [Cutaneotrichosporon oleaginosum]